MNSTVRFARFDGYRASAFGRIGTAVVAFSLLLAGAQGQRYQPTGSGKSGPNHGAPKRAEPAARPAPAPARAPQARPAPPVDRSSHGSLRHSETHVIERPEPRYPGFRSLPRGVEHHDVDADSSHPRFWHGFVYGHRVGALRIGFHPLFLLGVPYFFDDGIYYQRAENEYREVYPPLGIIVPELPEGAVEIDVGAQIYFYAAGAFYARLNDGFVVVPAPLGVTVPDPPPGAALVTVNGGVAYQFNGVYFRPIFVNGVTQYITFRL